MKKTLFSIFIALAFFLLATASVASDIRDDNARYNVMIERTFVGLVASTGHEMEGFVYFPMKVGDRMLEVQLGPKDFMKDLGFKLKIGEMVTVVGAPAKLAEREVLLAREVRFQGAVFMLRDGNGHPMWDPNRPVQMDPEVAGPAMCQMMIHDNRDTAHRNH